MLKLFCTLPIRSGLGKELEVSGSMQSFASDDDNSTTSSSARSRAREIGNILFGLGEPEAEQPLVGDSEEERWQQHWLSAHEGAEGDESDSDSPDADGTSSSHARVLGLLQPLTFEFASAGLAGTPKRKKARRWEQMPQNELEGEREGTPQFDLDISEDPDAEPIVTTASLESSSVPSSTSSSAMREPPSPPPMRHEVSGSRCPRLIARLQQKLGAEAFEALRQRIAAECMEQLQEAERRWGKRSGRRKRLLKLKGLSDQGDLLL